MEEGEMIKRVALAVTIAGVFLWGTYAFAGMNMQEGLWEITSRMEMPGMNMQMPERKSTQCLTKKTMVPKGQEKEEDCKITDQKIKGDTVTWTITCSGKHPMKAKGKTTYHGDTFTGTISMTSSDPAEGKMHMITHISGKRIGECPK